jgi:hypothetical protein
MFEKIGRLPQGNNEKAGIAPNIDGSYILKAC